MRQIPTPVDDAAEAFALCISNIADQALKERLEAITVNITAAALGYLQQGQIRQLYSIPPINLPDDAIVAGNVTKGELKKTYSDHMAAKKKPARAIYDRLTGLQPVQGREIVASNGYVLRLSAVFSL